MCSYELAKVVILIVPPPQWSPPEILKESLKVATVVCARAGFLMPVFETLKRPRVVRHERVS